MLKLDNVRNRNGFFEVFITGDEKLTRGDVVLSKITGDGEIFIRATNIEGIFTYGCKSLKDDYWGHKAGYIWSSRVGVMNQEFDVALMECYYKTADENSYICCAIDLAHLEAVLEDTEYRINYIPDLHFTEKEPYYRLEKLSNDD